MLISLKPLHYLPPLLALGGVSFLIYSRLQPLPPVPESSSDVAALNAAASPEGEPPAAPVPPAMLAKDWKTVAGDYERGMKSNDRLEVEKVQPIGDAVAGMSAAELQEIVLATEKIEWGDAPHLYFDSILVNAWGKKAPEAALNHYANRLKDRQFQHYQILQGSFKELAAADLPKATALLDRLIKSGAFEGRSLEGIDQVWMGFEAAWLQVAVVADYDATVRRMDALAEPARSHLLSFVMAGRPMTKEMQTPFIRICRKYLDTEEVGKVVGWVSSRAIFEGGLEELSRTLDRLEATPAQRVKQANSEISTALSVMGRDRKLTSADIITIRDWLARQGVKNPDVGAGKAIAGSGRLAPTGQDGAFELLRTMRQEGGSDELVHGFLLDPLSWKREADCLELATTIQDEALRNRALKEARAMLKRQ